MTGETEVSGIDHSTTQHYTVCTQYVARLKFLLHFLQVDVALSTSYFTSATQAAESATAELGAFETEE